MHASKRAPQPARELRPEHALLTPTWLGALALLVANDHWLKGSGMLPGVLTGKLSDFAGMLVAPVLLASLLCVSTRRGLLVCHVAVVVVFSGIQLSPEFAQLWSGWMGLLGHPWVITCDPTDLIAVPFAWLSWQLLTPAMTPDRPALIGLRRSAVAAASVFGLWATVATSDAPPDDFSCCWGTDDGIDGGNETWEPVEGTAYVHNPNEFEIGVTIRHLSPDVTLDCDEIATDPGRLLPDDAFGPAEHWLLPPTTNVAFGAWDAPCSPVKIGGEGIPEQIVFLPGFGGWETFPGSHGSIDELLPDGMAIVIDGDGGEWVGGEEFRYTPTTDTVALPEQCTPVATERRIDWSELPAEVVVEVLSKSAGLDGCFELELSPWTGTEYGPSFVWYLCAPEQSVRLEPGSHYLLTTGFASTIGVEAILVDPVLHTPLTNGAGQELFRARWARGLTDMSVVPNVQAVAVEAPECPWVVLEDCPTVERKLDLAIGADAILAKPGAPEVYMDSVYRHEFTLGRARALALVDNGCTSAYLPYDIDFALITEPLP